MLVLSNISVVNQGTYLIDVTYTFENLVDNGFVTVIILPPLCQLTSISPSTKVAPQVYTIFSDELIFNFDEFLEEEECFDTPDLKYAVKVVKDQQAVSDYD